MVKLLYLGQCYLFYVNNYYKNHKQYILGNISTFNNNYKRNIKKKNIKF